ncbi:hypothetical protein PBCV1_a539aR [Paramecium bursaria Chlorella virus 1]|uniref:Uncharacterized protein n=1 Tax=Paramecium bursaria Chlorella virus 1 TaxID=10506 RepID=F8TU53_PBCV1|nr:hypothetical protein PBCV1_a539aR [Paramecium bursaria Chlorella virus 1]AEI70114.1 hypothetical protein [Paramecium bursaria Chlorella virus 1]
MILCYPKKNFKPSDGFCKITGILIISHVLLEFQETSIVFLIRRYETRSTLVHHT